jgi:hypothetical protein
MLQQGGLARWYAIFVALLPLPLSAAVPPRAAERVTVRLPDIGAELRAFEEPTVHPVPWWPHVVNAGWGGGRGGPERNGGWLDKHWELLDYVDRSGDYTTHEYLDHRGIWYEVYGSNEYQETIHFHETGARKLFWDNGIAQDVTGRRVLSADYNLSVPWWAEKVGWEAFITCNNAPRWWAVIDYDWLTSPLLGCAISQDNIGGPTSRIGAGGHGRYCDFCNAKFMHYLATNQRLPELRRQYRHIRDYVQANLDDVLRQLPPVVKHRFDASEAELLARMCAPPVMSEYQKFLYLSHLHNFVRYYRDAKLVAQRAGRSFDVHGNQGGGFIGDNPYQVALADFVDMIWFESSGQSAYDVFKYHWNNAWGKFRYPMCRAMSGGRKPILCMSAFANPAPDLVEHEMAEQCAGGGVLFVNQATFEKQPELERKMTDYFRFRHAHRALFADPGKEPYAEIALAYSIPTMMYHDYQHSAAAAPLKALAGIARALEEGHLPYDVVIFNHPEIHADRATLDRLKRYRLVVLPALECLADTQIRLLEAYLQAGGTLGLLGPSGIRNEDNLPRSEPPLDRWRKAGKVVDLLPGREFLPPRATESPKTRELTQQAIAAVREALGNETIITGDLPRMLWLTAWRHGHELLSVHLVNYDVDYKSGQAAPTSPVPLTVTLPPAIAAEEAAWLVPGQKPQAIPVQSDGRKATVTIPSVRVYGILAIGRRGLDARASALRQAEAMLARATMAAGGNWGPLGDQALENQPAAQARDPSLACRASVLLAAQNLLTRLKATPQCSLAEAEDYARSAAALLQAVQQSRDRTYLDGVRQLTVMDGATPQFAFGSTNPKSPWKAVAADTAYTPQTGFGWLPDEDDSDPTPEETDYAMAQKYGQKIVSQVTAGRLLFWPYKEPPPAPLATNLGCGSRRRFRVDLPPGTYTVRVVTTNPSWTNRNFLVAGMVSAQDAVRLADFVQDRGALVGREFTVAVPAGKLDLGFGGPTGWAIAALLIRPGAGAEAAQPSGGLRRWHVSPRYPNPNWYPITQVSAAPETQLDRLPGPDWTEVRAPAEGLPVIELGTNRQADIGDVVYAVATLAAPAARTVTLHFGATSQAQLWLNGRPVAYVPNVKGLGRDELILPLELRAGENRLVVKLQRFWERRWMFCASLRDRSQNLQGGKSHAEAQSSRRPGN